MPNDLAYFFKVCFSIISKSILCRYTVLPPMRHMIFRLFDFWIPNIRYLLWFSSTKICFEIIFFIFLTVDSMFLSSGDKKSYIFCVIYFVRTIAPGELGGPNFFYREIQMFEWIYSRDLKEERKISYSVY
jgi:hypothetical protein